MLVRYFLESVAIAVVAYYIPRKNLNIQELAVIVVAAMVSLYILDKFAPAVGQSFRFGSGFGIGMSQVGGGHNAISKLTGECLNCDKPEDLILDSLLGTDVSAKEMSQNGNGNNGNGNNGNGNGNGTATANDTVTLALSDCVADDYYRGHRMPTKGAPGCPLEERFTTIERFMDDKMAIDYYANHRMPTIGEGGISERFESEIKNDQVKNIKPFEKAEKVICGLVGRESEEETLAEDTTNPGELGLVYGEI
jgi:uncharacterized protein YifE (UPF0438 family)